MNEPGEIKKLDETVINRIAAGEVIQRPANALKEMIENSLDAKSSNIQVVVKNGGLKLLQIQDNGTGIRKCDFEIVCERFTTSKLRKFDDLQNIATYGFRGEALASISHVAHLSILSKTANEKCAYKASFEDGKLKDPPKAAAGNQGTQITVEDLFYNMSVRKRALRSPAEEYQKICDVVGKYAIHNSKVGFALKKHGDKNDIRTPPNSTAVDNIRLIYGNNIARELIEFELENEKYKFKVTGHITNVNYTSKKFQFLLFINHRLVDCQSLRKCLDQVYTTYLPKNMHPFVYMSLELDPRNIDVNVHPTKHEVHFINEDTIVELISSAVETKLLGSNNSRMFYTQSKLPVIIHETIDSVSKGDKKQAANSSVYDKDFVRTDATEQKLEKFFGAPLKRGQEKEVNIFDTDESKIHNESIDGNMFNQMNKDMLKKTEEFEKRLLENTVQEPSTSQDKKEQSFFINKAKKSNKMETSMNSVFAKLKGVETDLTSVLELRLEVENDCHAAMRQLFAQHVFVGCINSVQTLIQHSTKLYLCNTQRLTEEMFYQFLLYNFKHFNSLKFTEGLPIRELALQALDLPESGWTEEDGDKNILANRIVEVLQEQSEMLNDYFSLEIDSSGNLLALPEIIESHTPTLSGLPLYILRLATEVNWEEEKECFKTFCRETATYYSQLEKDDSESYKYLTEYIFYPMFKEFLLPPKSFIDSTTLLQIADLPNLYKVFERC